MLCGECPRWLGRRVQAAVISDRNQAAQRPACGQERASRNRAAHGRSRGCLRQAAIASVSARPDLARACRPSGLCRARGQASGKPRRPRSSMSMGASMDGEASHVIHSGSTTRQLRTGCPIPIHNVEHALPDRAGGRSSRPPRRERPGRGPGGACGRRSCAPPPPPPRAPSHAWRSDSSHARAAPRGHHRRRSGASRASRRRRLLSAERCPPSGSARRRGRRAVGQPGAAVRAPPRARPSPACRRPCFARRRSRPPRA